MKWTGIFLLAASLASIPAAAKAENAPAGVTAKLRLEVAKLAAAIKGVVDDEGKSAIAIGEFIGSPPKVAMNFGPGLQQLLIEELNALKSGIVQIESDLSLTGKYSLSEGSDGPFIQIKIDIETSKGASVGTLNKRLPHPVEIKDNEVIAGMVGRPIALPAKTPKKELGEKILKELKDPTTPPAGTRIRASADSPFGFEVLVLNAAPAGVAGWQKVAPNAVGVGADKLPSTEIDQGKVYALKVYNDSDHDAAVSVLIDGLDVFSFTKVRDGSGRPGLSHYILKPKSTAVIPGWHRDDRHSASFLVTAYGEGASKLLNVTPSRPGIVSVTFARAWEGTEVPAEERGARSGTKNETGLGPDIENPTRRVQRSIGVVREIDVVRYSH